jgi:polysaccharide chain length determinant protein (PEP-CTERM system associated)
MNELIAQMTATLRSMWRRRWVGVMVAWIVGALGVVGLLRIPDRYEASARVFVDTKSVLKPLMRDLAVEPDIDQTINMLARTMITRPNVERLIGKDSMAMGPIAPAEREQTIEMLLREIKLTGSGRDNVFTFVYRDTDPVRARVVVEKLVSLFVESDLGAKARDTESAREFIDQQIKTYEARLAEAEGRLKEFKVRNLGLADSTGKDYFARMSALSEELGKITVELRAAEQSRDALKRELAGETITLVPEPLPLPEVVASPELDARIDSQRRQLDDLLRRYTDAHPDVVAARRVITRLEEQRTQDLEAKRKVAAARPVRVQPSVNPASQQIKLALAESEAAVASLRVRAEDLQSRVKQLRASASRVPQVEAEMAQLNRDYDIIRRNYETMVGRREKASLSEDVEATRLTNFRVIDPPRSAPTPVFPNRRVLAPVLLVFSLLAGVMATFAVVQLRPTFNSAVALRLATQRPTLGSVSALMTRDVVRRNRQMAVAFGLATMGLVAFYGVWIAWMTRATLL